MFFPLVSDFLKGAVLNQFFIGRMKFNQGLGIDSFLAYAEENRFRHENIIMDCQRIIRIFVVFREDVEWFVKISENSPADGLFGVEITGHNFKTVSECLVCLEFLMKLLRIFYILLITEMSFFLLANCCEIVQACNGKISIFLAHRQLQFCIAGRADPVHVLGAVGFDIGVGNDIEFTALCHDKRS